MKCKNCNKEIFKASTLADGTEMWLVEGSNATMFHLVSLCCIRGNPEVWHEPMPTILENSNG
jgi:hypothetical protein